MTRPISVLARGVSIHAWGLRLRRAAARSHYRTPPCCLPVSETPSARRIFDAPAFVSLTVEQAKFLVAHSTGAKELVDENYPANYQARGQRPLPATPETVAFYLTDLAGTRKPGTLTRRLSAISQAHQIAGVESPTKAAKVRLVMAGIRRTKGTAASAKTPVLVSDLRRMAALLPTGFLGIRDRALLLVGFCGAFRRSELVALDRADVEFTREGLVVHIRRSKTDQEGERRTFAFATASVCFSL